METATAYKTELLQVADAVAREKSIDREEVLEAMEQAISKAGRAKYGHEHDVRAEIDRKSGEIKLFRQLEVAEVVERPVAADPGHGREREGTALDTLIRAVRG